MRDNCEISFTLAYLSALLSSETSGENILIGLEIIFANISDFFLHTAEATFANHKAERLAGKYLVRGAGVLSDATEQEDRGDLGPFPKHRMLRPRQGWWVNIATLLESVL